MVEKVIVEIIVGIGGRSITFSRNMDFDIAEITKKGIGSFEVLLFENEMLVKEIYTSDLVVTYGYVTQEELDAEHK